MRRIDKIHVEQVLDEFGDDEFTSHDVHAILMNRYIRVPTTTQIGQYLRDKAIPIRKSYCRYNNSDLTVWRVRE